MPCWIPLALGGAQLRLSRGPERPQRNRGQSSGLRHRRGERHIYLFELASEAEQAMIGNGRTAIPDVYWLHISLLS